MAQLDVPPSPQENKMPPEFPSQHVTPLSPAPSVSCSGSHLPGGRPAPLENSETGPREAGNSLTIIPKPEEIGTKWKNGPWSCFKIVETCWNPFGSQLESSGILIRVTSPRKNWTIIELTSPSCFWELKTSKIQPPTHPPNQPDKRERERLSRFY